MADISKIKLGNTTYNVKDTTARSDINNLQTAINNIESITQTEIDEITDYTPASFPAPIYGYDTVADMQADTSLQEGMTCHTNGNATVGDGGAAYYTVGTSGDIALQGGLYADEINVSLSDIAIDEITSGITPSSDGVVNETGLAHLWGNIKNAIASSSTGVLVLGDSYGEGYTPDGNVNSWINYFISKVQQYGYVVYSSALGGAGFYRGDAAKKFSTLASNLIATLTTKQKESIGVVVVGGGYNDRNETRANIYNGMVELRDIISNNLPNVRRVLVFPFGMGVQGLTTGSHATFQYSTIVDMVNNYVDANADARLGTIVGNSYMLLRRNTYFSSDYVHPNQSGNYLIGSFVSDVFFGNSEPLVAKKFNDDYTPNLVVASGMTVENKSLRIFTSGGQFVLKTLGQMNITPSTPFDLTFDDNHPVTLGTFNDAALQQYGRISIPVSATVRSSTSTPLRYQQVIGEIDIVNGVMTFNAIATKADGTSYLTVSSVDLIRVKGLDLPAVDGLQLV